ncbi:hypothetical protein FGRMN_11073 [Fusarium graminum]|nr:hypothetical protein FGRMN_11073 [Fusarium graminum]
MTAQSITTDASEVETQMSVAGGPWGSIHEPIHESITLSALISSGYGIAQSTSVKNASNQDWEYIRGAIWNDDPDCQLFNDSAQENHTYSTGATWLYYYNQGKSEWNPEDLDWSRMKNPIGRSHYGDLQFLHCMASTIGEEPAKTKEKVMLWMEVMYKLANGGDGINPDTEVQNTKLEQFFPSMSLPPRFKPLSYMLAKASNFQGLDIRRRALGSMFHVIQDSYAIGHTQRTLLNPQDRESMDPLKFKHGAADRWGAIENFHTYSGQDSDAHSHYDHASDGVPEPGNLGNLDQWNDLIGCRDAVDKCKDLAALARDGKKWEDVKGFLEEVFTISPNARPANSQVL